MKRAMSTTSRPALRLTLPARAYTDASWFTVEMDVPKPDALTVLQESRAFIEPKLRKELGR